MKLFSICSLIFPPSFLYISTAFASCQGQIVGPPGKNSQYYYSSTCFSPSPSRTITKNEVCSVRSSTLVFRWTKVNWVSGSTGVQFGDCIVRTNYYDAFKINGSKLSTNVPSAEVTDVYVPNLGKEGNEVYWETIDGGGPRVEEGEHHRFYFEVMYQPDSAKKDVRIQATMVGEDPVFYIILPASIKTKDQLKEFVGNEDMNRIAPLVEFGQVIKQTKFADSDMLLEEFLTQNQVSERGAISVRPEKVAGTASIEFLALGSLRDVAANVTFCIGEKDRIASCSNSSNE